ncbi:peptidoglycan-binding protein [Salisediminibacterium halotolerans]|uniref:Beta-N-acetylglucosaminidase n=1 Tax=Salisediminibacterium halotolerans TaxID=517425 RepID=A0A1H9TX58_9BACI|nr:peptidoglycan-binding protein [Salisediminibacterium haloalkalitolerans]SES01497.1 Beta-N-acetylglucosaminidase [Salisediminibacterium haloalkalitolerans]
MKRTNKMNVVVASSLSITMVFSSFSPMLENRVVAEDGSSIFELEAESSFEQGDESFDVYVLKKRLSLTAEADIDEDQMNETFDEELESLLKQWQERNMNEASGVYDQETAEGLRTYLDEEKGFIFVFGDRDEDLSGIYEKLSELGYDASEETDQDTIFFGDQLESAVESFQSDYDLESHGAVDQATRDKLTEEVNALEENEESEENETDETENVEITEVEEDGEINAESGLVLREEPTTDAEEMDILHNEQEVAIHGEGEDWFKVTVETEEEAELEGYVHQDYVAVDEESDSDSDEENEEDEDVNAFAQSSEDAAEPPYQEGDEAGEIAEMKQMLSELGFGDFSEEPSDHYDSEAKNIVTEFQAHFGLEADGLADQETLDRLEEEVNTKYQDRHKSDAFRDMKVKLEALDYANYSSYPSDVYGSNTAEVVERFQEAEGLPVTGIADSVTLELLDERFADLPEGAYTWTDETPPFTDGDKNNAIQAMKEDLTVLGFGNFPSAPSNRYGSVTSGVVAEFQEHFGLEADGVADQTTLDRLATELNTKYQDRNESDAFRDMKVKLEALDYAYYSSYPSDVYGSNTAEVVERFQEAEGLPVTGIADSVTLELLDERFADLPEDAYTWTDETPPFTDGDKNNAIQAMKEDLTVLGFGNFPSAPSNRYGSVTSGVVAEFQEHFGLEADGVADQTTLDRLATELNTKYQDRNESDAFRDMKVKLEALDYAYYSSYPSDVYGSNTAEVVERFQEAEGLPVTGIADSVTLELLDERFADLPEDAYTWTDETPPFTDGDKNNAIQAMKEDLTLLGFGNFPSDPSNRYGSVTSGVVSEFQEHFGLDADGVADEDTLARLEAEATTDYQDGNESSSFVRMKQALVTLGYWNISDPSPVYGPNTAAAVERFQAAEGLPESGVGDSVTLTLLDERLMEHFNEQLEVPYEYGDQGDDVLAMKLDLTAVGFGDFTSDSSIRFDSDTQDAIDEFQDYYGLPKTGEADDTTLEMLHEILNSEYQEGSSFSGVSVLKQHLEALGYGDFGIDPSDDYDEQTKNAVTEFQTDHGLVVNGIADPVTLNEIEDKADNVTQEYSYTFYNMTIDQMVNRQMDNRPKTDEGDDGWVDADEEQVRRYVDPEEFSSSTTQNDVYQFLILSEPSGESADQLNRSLVERGILDGTGEAFKEAAETYGINDVYLMSHAILETGHGKSGLSNGSIKVGEVNSNKYVIQEPSDEENNDYELYVLEREYNESEGQWFWNESERDDDYDISDLEMTTIHNVFGIDAVDHDPYPRGAVYAYENGWTTPEDAILGGAEFISSSYLERGQDTLYKMRWDPEYQEAFINDEVSEFRRKDQFQYATDIGWAYKQTKMIKELYDMMENPNIALDMPEYKD